MMLPYLELPMLLETEGKPVTVKLKIQPSQITAYHELSEDYTLLYMGNQTFFAAINIENYESQIRSYWDIFSTKQTIKQKLKII